MIILILFQLILPFCLSQEINGKCQLNQNGNSCQWKYNRLTKKLQIYGNGEIPNYIPIYNILQVTYLIYDQKKRKQPINQIGCHLYSPKFLSNWFEVSENFTILSAFATCLL